ncbi:ATP-dependent acyl-CoA ligase [Rossellomorea marisflavi]|uniref:ATP-dependent acyl-CoA ligase n=1 Tax=Rossellomorea marisflavi TaxID=189381 RepID=UPI00279E3E1D|nr:ATP-dependent acyl-CoA ligase [Rossellomorea marisflavi]UTE73733.1 ATP-dependent acyl-CoA ligase [Rossellomorea marisflavi]
MYYNGTVGELLTERANEHPDKTFLKFYEEHYTYGEVDAISNKVANSLRSLGIIKGDKVAMLMDNSKEFVFSAFGILKCGAVEVPINTAHKKQLLHYQLNQSDAKFIIVGHEYMEEVAHVFEDLDQMKRIILVGSTDQYPHLPITPFSELLEGSERPVEVLLDYTDIQSIMFTSGTTGPSKGVLVTHRHCLLIATDWLKVNAFTKEDSLYTPLPLFHTIAHQLGLISALVAGASISIVKKFSASRFWDDVKHFNATVGHVIFAMIPILLNQPPSKNDKNHQLRSVYIGPSALSDRFEERFGVKVVEVYGASETAFLTSFEYGKFKAGSCGRANENYDLRLVDDRDNEVPVGQVGEFIVRSKEPYTLSQGYYNMPEETVQAFRNLWFHTGDLGYRDEEGYYYFVDRKKDAIRRRGENISSFEVESIVNSHPAVLESAAIAVPSELSEDEVKIVVVLKEGVQLSHEDFHQYCVENMAKFMVPRYIEFVNEMPKTATGKIQKVHLRQSGKEGLTQGTRDLDGVLGKK